MTKRDELLNQITTAIEVHQPELKISVISDNIELEGRFVLSDSQGEYDAYDVKVQVLGDFPQGEPLVYETGGRIPKIAARHVFPECGTCCLGVWEEWLSTASEHSFSEFLVGPLQNYFISQSYFELNCEWPFGERSHGIDGIVESYADVLGIKKEFKVVVAHLKTLSLPVAKGHLFCPCGSGKRLRHCHRKEINTLREKVIPILANRMLRRLESYEVCQKVVRERTRN